jgi:HPt (histidine-containing phosphotransfer) domain-containing protein
LLLDFHRDYAAGLEPILSAIAQSQLADAERQVHTLKGVAGNIGARDLYRAAEKLDLALRRGDEAQVRNLLPEVARELATVTSGLEPLFPDSKTQDADSVATAEDFPAGIDRASLKKSLRELSTLLRRNDPEAQDVLEVVRGLLKGSRRREIDRIAQALDRFDFRGAVSAVIQLAAIEAIELASDV